MSARPLAGLADLSPARLALSPVLLPPCPPGWLSPPSDASLPCLIASSSVRSRSFLPNHLPPLAVRSLPLPSTLSFAVHSSPCRSLLPLLSSLPLAVHSFPLPSAPSFAAHSFLCRSLLPLLSSLPLAFHSSPYRSLPPLTAHFLLCPAGSVKNVPRGTFTGGFPNTTQTQVRRKVFSRYFRDFSVRLNMSPKSNA